MSRALAALPIASLAFLAVLALSAVAVRTGFSSDDALRLWAGAEMAGDGQVPLGRIVAAYPTIPFLATALLTYLAPQGAPVPALLAAGLLGLLACIWFDAFRRNGLSAAFAGAATMLLAFHPTLLRAGIDGPGAMFLAVFLALFGRALYDLRARSQTAEVMTIGLALVGLAFSHPNGAAIAVAAASWLVFAVAPVLVASSAFNIVAALVFPTVFTVAAFVYVSWVFPGSGWSFVATPAESLSAWSAGMARAFGDGFPGSLVLAAILAVALALALGAPVVIVAVGWVRRRRPLVAPALVFAATIVTAAAITVATGLFGDPSLLAIGAPILAAVVIAKVPVVRDRPAIVLVLLALGWVGGLASLATVDPGGGAQLAAFVEGRSDGERSDALALGGATAGRDGVLADTDNAPALVLGRGHAHGLLGRSGEPFALALAFARIDTPFVAVPDPHSNTGASDRLTKSFPTLYRDGAPGYKLIYQNNTWRLFEHIGHVAVNSKCSRASHNIISIECR